MIGQAALAVVVTVLLHTPPGVVRLLVVMPPVRSMRSLQTVPMVVPMTVQMVAVRPLRVMGVRGVVALRMMMVTRRVVVRMTVRNQHTSKQKVRCDGQARGQHANGAKHGSRAHSG